MRSIGEILNESREERMEINYATPAYLQNRIAELEAQLDNVKSMHKSAVDIAETQRRLIQSFKEEVRQFVIDNLNGYVGNDDLKGLADAFDISLTQQISFTATVTFNVTADVPIDYDIDDIDGGDFSAYIDYNGDMENVDTDYHEVEISDMQVLP